MLEASAHAYAELIQWIERAQATGAVRRAPPPEIAFAFHALCQGLAGAELSREAPPVGAGFWHPVRGIDGERLWRQALEALVAGLAPR